MAGAPLPPATTPFLNPATGLVNTEWYLVLRGIIRFFGNGILVAIGASGQALVRSIIGGPGIYVANGDGTAGNPTISDLGPDNFGFNVGGLMTDGEYLGSGVFDEDVVFPSALKSSVVVSENPATAESVLVIKSRIAGVETQAGTITFEAGETIGTVEWSPSPYTHPANTPLKLYAPTTHDATLSKVTGLVTGDLS